MSNPQAGALVVFEGLVRNHNEGQAVASLEYESYSDLALLEAEKILNEARSLYDVFEIQCVHRIGHLNIKEIAVWVGVTSAHRKDGFKACQYVIDELKVRLPIWKKEYYLSGDATWVNCQQCSHTHHSIAKEDYYEKQLQISEIGEKGQKILEESHLFVIGAGGLGCPALTYLATAGVGHITLCDADRVDPSNLHRQTLYQKDDIGKLKAPIAAQRLSQMNPHIEVDYCSDRLTAENIESLITDFDLVLDCSDNFTTKFLVHDYCYDQKIPLVQSSLYQFEGQIRLFDERSGGCLRCTWPEEPEASCTGTCTQAGTLGAVAGVFGSLQALEALKVLLKIPTTEETRILNLLTFESFSLVQDRDLDCPLCGRSATLIPFKKENYIRKVKEWEVSDRSLQNLRDYEWVDIRLPEERKKETLPQPALELPFHRDALMPLEPYTNLDPNKKYLLVCSEGLRSRMLAEQLRTIGFEHFYSYGLD